MTRCEFETVGTAEDGRAVVHCRRCGLTVRTRSDPDRTHCVCRSGIWLGFGDAVAWLTAVTGIDRIWRRRAASQGTSCGCNRRRRQLNRLRLPARLRGLIAYLHLWRQTTCETSQAGAAVPQPDAGAPSA